MGVRGTYLDWYCSYLDNRTIRVKCVTSASGQLEYSDVYNIKFGAPQGSCLGPLIFLIFNNDLYMHLQYCQCILFADDTIIYHTHQNLRHLEWCIKEDLAIISDWFNANQLTLNLNKTVCMLFAPNIKNVSLPEEIDFNGMPIPVVKSTKFLGVHIDDKLSFREHYNSLVMKLKRNTNMLKCSKHHLSTHGKKILYYGHIYSHIVYCIGVWGSILPVECIKKLQKLQNKCIMLVDLNKIPLEAKYKINKILQIKEIILLESCKLGYKIVNNELPTMVHRAITTDSKHNSLNKYHRYSTCYKALPNAPLMTGKTYKNSFLTQKYFKNIQSFMFITKKAQNIKHFTVLMKDHLFS